MAYVGGKTKGAKHIIDILNDPKYDNLPYVEPFVGYGHILRRVVNKKKYNASDSNKLVLVLLKGIQQGLEYPEITKERYTELKNDKKNFSFERAIAAFCYSYNGKEWGGYTHISKCHRRENYPKERKNYYDRLKKNDIFKKTRLKCIDYRKLTPTNCLIYCDPPYHGTTGYNTPFDHDIFWDTMRLWSKTNHVFISEYNAPPDFVCIAQTEKHSSLSGSGSSSKRTERLFTKILS